MADKDFTKRVQTVEESIEKLKQDLRGYAESIEKLKKDLHTLDGWTSGMILEIANKQNGLVNALEKAGALEPKKKIVTLS